MDTIQLNEQEIKLAPALDGSVNWLKRIRRNDFDKYWMDVIGKETLEDDETIRITATLPYREKSGAIVNNQHTLTDQVRSPEEFVKLIQDKYNSVQENDLKKLIGFSMSSGVFKYRSGIEADGTLTLKADGVTPTGPIPPGIEALRYIQNMVIDLDSHPTAASGERFHFNSFNEISRRLISMRTLNYINNTLKEAETDMILQVKNVYCTGGGLQFIIPFSRPMRSDEAKKAFYYIKTALKQAKERLLVYGFDELDNVRNCSIEFDDSSGDISHTQRVGGLVNPKSLYNGSFAEELKDFYDCDKLDDAQVKFRTLADNCILDEISMRQHKKDITEGKIVFDNYYNNSSHEVSVEQILIRETLHSKSNDTFRDVDADLRFNSPMDFEILKKIPVEAQFELMTEGLTRLDIKGTYNTFICPFHKDNNASFAVYHNLKRVAAVARDFHDDSTYNLITFLMAEKEALGQPARKRNEVIQQLAIRFNIEFNKTERKQFTSDNVMSAVDSLISKIDTENFVYYRLANKNRACIIREFENGEAYTFDGTHMMSDHILLNQLSQHQADGELRSVFHDRFVDKVLVNAFEEFYPGKDYTYERNFIKYVNLWIPGRHYKKVHEYAQTIEDMDIVSALGLVKNRLPVMWHYLNQITQKGNIEYFTNWLAAIAKFEVMSSIPVVTSVQGTGKNLFIDEVLSFYLNHEYVNVVNGDKINNNFNSFLETSSLVVLDEGDFSNTKELNNLKLISGNKFIQVEKKGVDSSKKMRHFNMIMFTNGDTPLHHPSNDRRISYFRLDVTLEDSVKYAGYEFIDDFIDDLRGEVAEFWAIMVKTKTRKEWNNMNIKDNQFNKQILLMHPFGKLVIKLVENDWEYIRLQMNENVSDPMVIQANLEMLALIKTNFEQNGNIDLTLVNRYIHSLNFRSYLGVQQFIDINQLHKNGITKVTTATSVKIVIDKNKVANLIHMNNNLGNLYDAYSPENINKTLYKEILTIEEVISQNKVKEQIDIEEMGLTPAPNIDPLGLTKPIDPNSVVF